MFDALCKVLENNGVLLKRGHSEVDFIEKSSLATKMPRMESTCQGTALRGLTWDSKDYSCAYDSLFTILYNIWTADRFKSLTESLTSLTEGFNQVQNESITIETARDTVRLQLHHLDSRQYPMGTTYMCLAELTHTMMTKRDRTSGTTCLRCMACGYKRTLLQISECFEVKDTGPFQDGQYEKGYISDCLGWHLSNEQKKSPFTCRLYQMFKFNV